MCSGGYVKWLWRLSCAAVVIVYNGWYHVQWWLSCKMALAVIISSGCGGNHVQWLWRLSCTGGVAIIKC